MDRALYKLLSLQARAALRRAARQARTVKGAVLAAIGLALFLAWLLPAATMAAKAPPVDPALVRTFAPLALLALTLTSALSGGEKAIEFTPAEVNFLFAGPFTRRHLLAYKLAKAAAGSLLLALLLSLALRRFSPFGPAAFVGGLLALLAIHLCTAAVALAWRSLAARAATPLRHTAVNGLIIAAAAAIGLAVAKGQQFLGPKAAWVQSPVARAVVLPLQPFVRAYVAQDLGGVAAWGAAALLIDAALLALVFRLDADYFESAAAAGERAYELRARMRRGEWMPGVKAAGLRRRVPALPWLGGAGPVAWRQLTALVRTSSRLGFAALLCGVTVVPVLLLARRSPNVQGAIVPAVGWLTILLVGALRYDFRGDLDQMAWLKSLPLRPLPLAAGQLAVPALALVVCHVACGAAVAWALPPLRVPVAVALVLAPPLDLLLAGIENLAFLLLPHRQTAPTELGALGRQMLMILLKLLATAVPVGIAGAFAAVVFGVSRSLPAAVAAAFVVLAAQALALVPLVALAYSRFDPSADTPP